MSLFENFLANPIWDKKELTEIEKIDAYLAKKPSPSNLAKAMNYHRRGLIYMDEKNFPQAIADFSQALALDPNNESEKMFFVRSVRAKALCAVGLYSDAVNDFSHLLPCENGTPAEYHFSYACACLLSGEEEEAKLTLAIINDDIAREMLQLIEYVEGGYPQNARECLSCITSREYHHFINYCVQEMLRKFLAQVNDWICEQLPSSKRA